MMNENFMKTGYCKIFAKKFCKMRKKPVDETRNTWYYAKAIAGNAISDL